MGFVIYSAGNGNLKLPVYFVKAKQGYKVRKKEEGNCV
jgi:hypothetical protein